MDRVEDEFLPMGGFYRPGKRAVEGVVMATIVWVTCPKCEGQFYCKSGDFEDSEHRLLCPYCNAEFLFKESPKVRR